MSRFDPHVYLNQFQNFESNLPHLKAQDFHLERMHDLLDALDRPQLNLRIVHVAGTKGKGSTCAFIAYALQQAGYKVGLFTSPHLFRVNERLRVLDQSNLKSEDPFAGSISDSELADLLKIMKPAIEATVNKHGFLTYFEVLTALGVVQAASHEVDVYVVETGLGGRLDATNALDSHIAVITPISMDHQQLLGHTLTAIATEKAGIIKDKYQEVIIARQEPEVMDVLTKHCQDKGAVFTAVLKPLDETIAIALEGAHQRMNAGVAWAVLACLRKQGLAISDADILLGLANTKWPGRFEVIGRNPSIIVDGAHNDASARVLAETIKTRYQGFNIVVLLGVSNDKDIKSIIGYLNQCGDECIFTRAQHPRSYDFKSSEMAALGWTKRFTIESDLNRAFDLAKKQAGPSGVVLVTGSLFLVAQVMRLIKRV